MLVSALLNQRLLDDAISRLETAVRASADRMTVAAAQQVDSAKEIAAALVTRAGEWSADRLRTAADEVGRHCLARCSKKLQRQSGQARPLSGSFG